MFNNNYNEDFFLPRYENYISHQEMISQRRNRVLYENKDYVYRHDYCPSCMSKALDCPSCVSKPPDKQIMFPVCEEPLPSYIQQMPSKSTSDPPLIPFVSDERNTLSMIESKESNQLQHYPRYLYNNNEQNIYYNDYPGDRDLRYGMNHYIDRDMERRSQQYYSMVNNSNTSPRQTRVSMEQYPGGTVSRSSNEYRYMRNSQEYHLEKNQIPKNEIEEITKDSLEWKNSETKNEKESTEETNENHYEGLMDIKKTIKKDYNKKKWRKMTQELFNQILDFEKKNPNIKQCEIEKIFLVNRSTYWRWKKRLLS